MVTESVQCSKTEIELHVLPCYVDVCGCFISATKEALEASLDEGRLMRRTKTAAFAQLLPDPVRRQRKQLTPEERVARKAKVN